MVNKAFLLVVSACALMATGLLVPLDKAQALPREAAVDTTAADDGKDGEEKKEPKKQMKRSDYSRRLASKLKPSGPPPPKPKYQPWNKVVTKDHKKHDGLIPLYIKQEEVLAELGEEQMDKPILTALNISRGIGSHFVYGGLQVVDGLIDFHRVEDHVQIRQLSTQYRAPGDENLQKTIDLTFSESIMASLPIKTEKDGKVVVDVTQFFLSDASGIGDFLGLVFNQPVRMDGKKGYFDSIKNYPENTELDTRLTFMPSRVQALNLPNVPDSRYVQVGVHWSLRKLPEEPMMPRIAEDRIGYFTTVHKDFTREDEESFFVYFANRWRLEKKDPDASLSEPVKPIVYYIDHTVPDRYVRYIKEGVESWQRAFEKAGFKNAIIAKRAPSAEEDPDYDPDDARYNTLRWNVSDQLLYSAIGPSRVDPRTGEILDADILFEHAMVAGFGSTWRRMAEPRTALMALDPGLKEFWMTDEEKAEDPLFADHPFLRGRTRNLCAINDCMSFNGHMQRLAMLAHGLIEKGGSIPEEFIGDALRFVAAHEVGHTLGLRHNFKSSGSTPYHDLNDKDVVARIGMTGSIMDYPSANIARDPDRQGYYYSPDIGTYDDWAIEWGYKPVRGDNEWEQSKNLERIAAKSTEKAHLYGTDWDAYPAHALDPRVNIWDLSDDPLAWASERIAVCDDVLKSGKLEDVVVADGEGYAPLRAAVVTLLLQKFLGCNMAVKNVGGQYAEAAHKGDGVLPLDPVPASRQREALEFVIANGLDVDRFLLPPGTLNKLSDLKMASWQNNLYQPRRYDFPLTLWVQAIQNALLTNLTNPWLQSRVVEAQVKVRDPFTLADLYDGLTRAVWTDAAAKEGPGAVMQRNLQRLYTQLLISQITTPRPATPQDAISLSRLHLQRIRQSANSRLQGSGLDDATNAHLLEMVARIDRALEAQRVTGF